tara:strand:- start:296 stop:727 length:432 start_codon:yes stop_codon:yes gene_type:complete
MSDEAPKIIVDDDWKSQAQAEKQKLADEAKAKQAAEAGGEGAPNAGGQASGGGGRQLPPASFETLVSTMTTQALFAMGEIPDPQTGQRMAHLDLARHHIDMLSVIAEKTEGNLSKEESDMIATTLYELRNRYVQLTMSQRPTA